MPPNPTSIVLLRHLVMFSLSNSSVFSCSDLCNDVFLFFLKNWIFLLLKCFLINLWKWVCVVLGGKLVYQTTKKRASGPKCPVTGKRIQGVWIYMMLFFIFFLEINNYVIHRICDSLCWFLLLYFLCIWMLWKNVDWYVSIYDRTCIIH